MMAPMPATVASIAVAAGDVVATGDVLLVLEAMKMELPVRASRAGTVRALHCRQGEMVQPGVALIDIG
jgi:biotin carboxyl carrier protein